MAVLVVEVAALRTVEHGGPAAAVAAHLGLQGLEDTQGGRGDGHSKSPGVGGVRRRRGRCGTGLPAGASPRGTARRRRGLRAQGGVVALRVRREQPVGRGVVGRDGRLDLPHPAPAPHPRGQRVEQHTGQSPAAVRVVDGDLPDDQGLGAVGAYVTGDEGDGLAVGAARHQGGGREVATPQQIAVRGVEVQDLGVAGDAPDRGSVLHSWAVDLREFALGVGSYKVFLRGGHVEEIYPANFENALREGVG